MANQESADGVDPDPKFAPNLGSLMDERVGRFDWLLFVFLLGWNLSNPISSVLS